MAMIALFLMAPLIVVFGVSLNEKQSLLFPPAGLSLDWYAEIFTDDGWRGALFPSGCLAALPAALAVIVALPPPLLLWRRRAPWSRVFQALSAALFLLQPVITALGFLPCRSTAGFTSDARPVRTNG